MNNLCLHNAGRTLALLITVTLTGCASFPGSYAPLEPTAAASSEKAAGPAGTGVTRLSAGGSSHAVSAEYDTTVISKQPAAQTVARAEERAEPLFPPRTPAVRPETATDADNPFAAMADQQIRQTSFETSTPKDSGSHLAGFIAYAENASISTFREAEPRLPTSQPGAPAAADVTVAASPLAQAYPDEYIFDGGDRDHPVHYYGDELQGLDTEDTVAEFRDHEGGNHVRASNRVAVYAPRFGAVQTVSGLNMDVKVDKAAGATDISGLGTLEEERGLDISAASSGLSGLATRNGASGVETARPVHMSEKTETPILANQVDQGLEAKTSDGLGIIETTSLHELHVKILEPATGIINTGIDTKAATSQATQTYSTYRLAAMVGSEKGGRKGELHLTKEASPLIAKPGDTITFKIHFRNTGDYNIHDVRIIDNLTPRLIYTDGSGHVDVGNNDGGSLTVVPNREGSQTLIFELDRPLQGTESGTITFEAVVR
ncbi:MAG: hypothetical protein RIK87_30195 [Fuerstiella sp.]